MGMIGSGRAMSQDSDDARVAEVERWFAERNFRLSFEEGDGLTWVNLIRRETGYTVSRYGQGASAASAASRARQRWEQEQGA
jgi:hypothetical protein